MEQSVEQWRDIPGYENYQASSFGRVKRLSCLNARGYLIKEKILTISVQKYNSKGYLKSFVSIGLGGFGKCKSLSVGRAVLLAFVGPPPSSSMNNTRHLDDDITNNRIDNLSWGTHKQNVRDAVQNGRRITYGENVHNSKLKEDEVVEIRRVYKTHSRTVGARALAKRFGVEESSINQIIAGRTWKHLLPE